MRLKSTKEITREDLHKAAMHNAAQGIKTITTTAAEWMANEDLLQTALGTKESLREKIVELVNKYGKGDDTLRVGNYELSAKEIKGSEYVDGELLHAALLKNGKKYVDQVLSEKVTYVVDESKLIQLVERGLISAKILKACSKTRPDRGTRITVQDIRAPKRRKKNATH